MEHCEVNVAYFIEDEQTFDKRVRPMREGTFLYYSLADIEELLVSLIGMSMKKFSFEEKCKSAYFQHIKHKKRELPIGYPSFIRIVNVFQYMLLLQQ